MRLWKGKAGFILVELIIATAILAAVIPLSKFFIDTIKATREAKIQQTANHLAQKYMEEYKGKSLPELYAVLEQGTVLNDEVKMNKRNYKVSVAVDWVIVGSASHIGTVWIKKDSVNSVNIKLESNNQEQIRENTFFNDPENPENAYDLKLTNSNYLDLYSKNDDQVLLTVPFNLPSSEPKELNLVVCGDPVLELNVQNRHDFIEKLIINKTEIEPINETPNFKLFIEKDMPKDIDIDIDALIRDTEQLEESELGVNIIVTVKDAEDVELVKIAETRKIEWSRTYEVPQG
jgi:type II secretory pathway pseudopilin PulG